VRAKDLSVVEPEPLDCSLEGYAWIPRMLDKARAHLAGTGSSYMFGCPVDHTCMARLGIAPELVLELAAAHDDDREVLAALREHGIPTAEEAWFDGPAVEDELQLEDVYLRVRRASGTFTGADHGAAVSVEIVDAEPGFDEALHTHPTEEVVVAVEGAATYYLGEWQARIVRAGQVVRIPAGIAHRFTTRERFRAVAAFGAPEIVTLAATPRRP
jgi:quercetin dioxygenase-like cupin family protein